MNVLTLIILISIMSSVEYIGDAKFKQFATSNNIRNFGEGYFLYTLMIIVLIYVLKFANVLYVNLLWDGTSVVIESLLAFILLGNRLTNIYQYSGLFVIIIGIVLLSIGHIPQ